MGLESNDIMKLVEITQRIISIFNQIEKYENADTDRLNLNRKLIFELRDLISVEDKIYNELAKTKNLNELAKKIGSNIIKFKMTYLVTDDYALKRIIKTISKYFAENSHEFDYNPLAEYTNIDINDYRQINSILDAFNEEIYLDYLTNLKEFSNKKENNNVKSELIKMKFDKLRIIRETNSIYIKSFAPKKISTRLYKMLEQININLTDFNDIKYNYIRDYFGMFLMKNLILSNEEIYQEENWVEVTDQLILLETLLDKIEASNVGKLEDIFYKMHYSLLARDCKNTIISELILNLLKEKNQIKKSKRK